MDKVIIFGAVGVLWGILMIVRLKDYQKAWCDVTGKPWPEGMSVKDIVTTDEGSAAFALMGERLGKAAAPLLNGLSIDCVLFGGQISKSFFLMERTLRQSLSSVPSLRFVGPLPDLDHATFNGLRSLK